MVSVFIRALPVSRCLLTMCTHSVLITYWDTETTPEDGKEMSEDTLNTSKCNFCDGPVQEYWCQAGMSAWVCTPCYDRLEYEVKNNFPSCDGLEEKDTDEVDLDGDIPF